MAKNNSSKSLTIVSGLMAVSGILILTSFFYVFWRLSQQGIFNKFSWYGLSTFLIMNNRPLIISILFIVFAYFLKKRKKWAWFVSVILLLKESVSGISSLPTSFFGSWNFIDLNFFPKLIFNFLSLILLVFILISLILLLLEKKNYQEGSS